jgi:hypothetical protein
MRNRTVDATHKFAAWVVEQSQADKMGQESDC